ncbi:glycoside hydrolase superfamily [Aspergillus tetrazonus]
MRLYTHGHVDHLLDRVDGTHNPARLVSDRNFSTTYQDLESLIILLVDQTLFVCGNEARLFFLKFREFHHFRLRSPGLWLDIFQKIRATGFTCVSFYVDWALLEGEQGHFRMEDVFALEEFFDAAMVAGIYLIAHQDYLDAITPYMRTIGEIIARAQIHNGGPVILFQPENEYTLCYDGPTYTQVNNYTLNTPSLLCLDKDYMAYVQEVYRNAGIEVPFIVNDAHPVGGFAPNTGTGAADIYSFDYYPLGLGPGASDSSDWSSLWSPLLTYNITAHEQMSGDTPFSISEYQRRTTDRWGGVGAEAQAALINHEFARVFYKLNYGMHIAIQNLYMWLHLLRLGAAISENRLVTREVYSELKLQANFLLASPIYLTMMPENAALGVYTDRTDLQVIRLSEDLTAFHIVHHHDLASRDSSYYALNVRTSLGSLTIPHVDYDLDGIKLIYSTAEIFTWKCSSNRTILILYGDESETHEFAVLASLGLPVHVEGDRPKVEQIGPSTVVQWRVSQTRGVIAFSRLEIHLVSRNAAYNYWVIGLTGPGPIGRFASAEGAHEAVIVRAGYLLRTAEIIDDVLHLTGDVNATTSVEVISTPSPVSPLVFNGEKVKTKAKHDWLVGEIRYKSPKILLPDLASLSWGYMDALPEIKGNYNDQAWTSTVDLLLEGWYGFGYSVWLNSTYLGSWPGSSEDMFHNKTLHFPANLTVGSPYVLTVLMDHMGLDQMFPASPQYTKDPCGILDYGFSSREKSTISWKVAGNLGGEHYHDWTPGPLNEGATFPERHGYHFPHAPLSQFEERSPFEEILPMGVGFYATTFNLSLPAGYDVPLSIAFEIETAAPAKFRAVFYVNGWQFGKYINNIGPQTRFPVPEGILNYSGDNSLALILWSQEQVPFSLPGLSLMVDAVIQSGYKKPTLVKGAIFTTRSQVY